MSDVRCLMSVVWCGMQEVARWLVGRHRMFALRSLTPLFPFPLTPSRMRYLPAILLLSLFACVETDEWAGVTFPADQESTEMSFRRLAMNGDLEPVLEVGQTITDWRFRVRRAGIDSVFLYDRSGIDYRVARTDLPAVRPTLLRTDAQWTASGRVSSLDRDLAGRRVTATLDLTAVK